MGWADDELTKQKRDLKEVFDFCYIPRKDLPDGDERNKTIDGVNQWPEGYPEIRSVLIEYFDEMTRCSYKLLHVFCLALGLTYEDVKRLFDGGVGFARLNYYAPLSDGEDEGLGIQPHTGELFCENSNPSRGQKATLRKKGGNAVNVLMNVILWVIAMLLRLYALYVMMQMLGFSPFCSKMPWQGWNFAMVVDGTWFGLYLVH